MKNARERIAATRRRRLLQRILDKACRCSICQRPLIGPTYDASPVNGGRCCSQCHAEVVIPAATELALQMSSEMCTGAPRNAGS